MPKTITVTFSDAEWDTLRSWVCSPRPGKPGSGYNTHVNGQPNPISADQYTANAIHLAVLAFRARASQTVEEIEKQRRHGRTMEKASKEITVKVEDAPDNRPPRPNQ